MKNKRMIWIITMIVGTICSLIYTFLPYDSFNGRILDIVIGSGKVSDLIKIDFFANNNILFSIILLWLPAVLLIASIVLLLVLKKSLVGAIIGFVGVLDFVVVDILIIIDGNLYSAIYLNLAGCIIVLVSCIMLLIDNKVTIADDEICGEIKCLSGQYAGGTFYISHELIIGRDSTRCNIVLSNNEVSRRHCRITYIPETDTYTVMDMSKNGTFQKDGKRFAKDFEMQVPRKTEIYMGKPREVFFLD